MQGFVLLLPWLWAVVRKTSGHTFVTFFIVFGLITSKRYLSLVLMSKLMLLNELRCEPWGFLILETCMRIYFRLFFSPSSILHLLFPETFYFLLFNQWIKRADASWAQAACWISIVTIFTKFTCIISLLCDRVPKHVSSETFPFLQSTFLFMLIVNWCLLMKTAMWEGLISLQLEPLQVILWMFSRSNFFLLVSNI